MGGLDLPFSFIIMEDINDLVNSQYIIRRRLADLKRAPGQSHYEYYIGNSYRAVIFTAPVREHNTDPNDNIVRHANVDISIYEPDKRDPEKRLWKEIYMYRDSRFMNYEPIRYGERNHLCSGNQMPLTQVCELIRYLHKLEKLSAFL